MYKIGICDDGEYICTNIEKMASLYAENNKIQTETKIWYSGEKLEEYLAMGEHLDILFLDIELLSMTGMEVGSYIRDAMDNSIMQIVYISGKASYAQQLFKTQPLDFLVKPITQAHIDEVLDRALRVIEKKNAHFRFQRGKEYYYIPMGDVVYLVSQGRKIRVVTSKETFEFYGRLKEAAQSLSEDFVTIHKSFVVNKSYIRRYTYDQIELYDGTILTISPTNRKQVRDIILREE